MIFASFQYELIIDVVPVGRTTDFHTVNMDFRSIYQINPDHEIFLKYASIAGNLEDAGLGTLQNFRLMARLIGNFNETRNILPTITVPLVQETAVGFSGIAFSMGGPFVAPDRSNILMPSTFQVEFKAGSQAQTAAGDFITVWFTIGYDIEPKRRNFGR